MSTKSKQVVAEVEAEIELLEVNVYYGRIPAGQADQEGDSINIDPFVNNGFRVTSVPVYLHDPMANILTYGVTVPRRNPVDAGDNDNAGVHITGEQIARGYAWNTLLKQVELLASVVNPGTLSINIARCGLIGKYAMRFLVGIPGIKVSFLEFPPSWRGLDKLAPITNQHYFFNTAADKEEAPAEPVVEAQEEAPEPKKQTGKKKTVASVVVEEEEVEKPAPKKRTVKAKAVAASEEQLAGLADKFPTTKKPATKKKTVVEEPVEEQPELVVKKPAKKRVVKTSASE